MSIEARGIGKRFGDFVALDDVDLTVASGQLTALLGPSCGGKSTLLRIIAGLDTASSGSVEIEGVDATRLPPQKRNVGFVFQHYAVFKHMTVAKNVAFGMEIRKRPKADVARRVDELLELVHLSQFAHRMPSQLSGGQRQRMALARALAVEPSVLLLDEPSAGLSPVRQDETFLRTRRINKTGVCVVMVEQNATLALSIANRGYLVRNGVIVLAKGAQELLNDPAVQDAYLGRREGETVE